MVEKRSKDETSSFATSDLQYILDVNKKAVEIYVEVDKQNERVIENLETLEEVGKEIQENLNNVRILESNLLATNTQQHNEIIILVKTAISEISELNDAIMALSTSDTELTEKLEATEKEITEMSKTIFKLNVILGSAGVGAIIAVIQALLHK